MEKICGIYGIRSLSKPERVYIGSAINIENRWKNHLNKLRKGIHYNRKLQGHYNEYGERDMVFELIIQCDKNNLIKAEQAFMDLYQPWFNICPTAGSQLGFKHSDEVRELLRKIKIGTTLPHTEEWCRNISEGNMGRASDPEHIERLRLMNLGNQYCLGHKHTPESKAKMAAAAKGRKPWNRGLKNPYTPGTIARMSESAKNRHHPSGDEVSEETRRKISINKMGNKYNLGHKHTEEAVERMRASKLGEKNAMYGKIPPNARKVVNIETGTIYDTVALAVKAAGCCETTMLKKLHNPIINNTKFRFYEQTGTLEETPVDETQLDTEEQIGTPSGT